MSEEAFEKPAPRDAWGAKPGPSGTSAEETAITTETTPVTPFTSVEEHHHLAKEVEALDFVQDFIRNNEQDTAGKIKFLEMVVVICEARTVEGFTFFPSDLLVQVVKILNPWTGSMNTAVRKRALEVVVVICEAIRYFCGYQATTEFPGIGQLIGCLALCHFDTDAMVASWAAKGLSHLYGFAARCRGRSAEKQEYLCRFLERSSEEEEEEEDTLKNAIIIPQLFKGVLSLEEVSGIYLTALHGFQDNNVHNIHAAVCIEKTLRRDPSVPLAKVPEIVSFLHSHLDSFHRDRLVWENVKCILRLLIRERLSEVVYALLSRSPQCDSSATILWGMLVGRSMEAAQVFHHLMACLKGQPEKPHLSAEELATLRLAAAQVFPALLDQPPIGLSQILEARWVTAFVNLLFWISHVHQGIQESALRLVPESAGPASQHLAKSSADTLRHLLEQFRSAMLPQDQNAWRLLGSADSFHHGVALFFRNIHGTILTSELDVMMEHVMAILNGHDSQMKTTAMTIFAELLRTRSDSIAKEEPLRHLVQQLSSPIPAVHSLALDGMLHMAGELQQVWKLLPLLPEAVTGLRESDRPRPQRLFDHLQHCLEEIDAPDLAVEAALFLVPLFDSESDMARIFAVNTFRAMLARGMPRAFRNLALYSFAPLLLHLHDENPIVVNACWEAMCQAASILGCHRLLRLVQTRDRHAICLVIVKRFRKNGQCDLQEQIVARLKSPQNSIREAVASILGLLGQETRDRRRREAIQTALQDLRFDEDPSVSSRSAQVICILDALHEGDPPRWSLRDRLRRILRGWCC